MNLGKQVSSAVHRPDIDVDGGGHCDDDGDVDVDDMVAVKMLHRPSGRGRPGYFRLISLLTSLSIVPTTSGVNAVNTTLYSDM